MCLAPPHHSGVTCALRPQIDTIAIESIPVDRKEQKVVVEQEFGKHGAELRTDWRSYPLRTASFIPNSPQTTPTLPYSPTKRLAGWVIARRHSLSSNIGRTVEQKEELSLVFEDAGQKDSRGTLTSGE
jgi:hypothetical protein